MSTAEQITERLRALDFPAEWEITARISARAKKPNIKVDEHVHVTVTVPEDADVERVVYFVRTKRIWLYRQARLLAPYKPDHPVKDIVGGESFPLLGRNHRLRFVDEGPPLRCDETTRASGWTTGYTQEIHIRSDFRLQARDMIIGWYCRSGAEYLHGSHVRSLTYWTDRLGLAEAPGLLVDHLKPRQWASYNIRANRLRLHWALFQLDPGLVEYAMVDALRAAPRRRSQGPLPITANIYDASRRSVRLAEDGARAWLGDTRTDKE